MPEEDRRRHVTHSELHEFREEVRSDIRVMSSRFEEAIRALSQQMEKQRQPFTAFAGWAAVVLALVGAVLVPRIEADGRHDEALLRIFENQLEVAYERGSNKQEFDTLRQQINAGIINRKDLHERLRAEMKAAEVRIDLVAHSVDNGLGRRIDEKIAPLITEQDWIKRRLEALP